MGVKTGFKRTLLMGAVVVMMGCTSVGAQHRPHRPQARAHVEVRFYGQQYFTPYRYRAYRPYMRGPVVYKSPPRGVINRSRVAPRPNPQRRRSMQERPDRQERPNVRPNRQERPDVRPDRDRARRARPRGVSMDNIRERISAWATSRRTSRPAVLELPPLPVIDLPEFSDEFFIDLDYLPEPPPVPEPTLGESYDE